MNDCSNKDNSLVSVIITTYGRKFDVIERSILSAHNQTYTNIEIILVDDNGIDSEYSKEIKQNLMNYPYVTYIEHPINMGAQVARNTGIKASHGEYIAMLDDDDEWLPKKIELQRQAVKPGVGLVYTKGYTVTINGDSKRKEPYYTAREFKKQLTFNDMLFSDRIGTTTQVLIPKNVFKECGMFDVKQPARQDYEMWIRISEKFDCVGVDEFLFLHYVHAGEQISKSGNKAIIGYQNIYNKYKDSYEKNPAATCQIYIALFGACRNSKRYIYSFKYLSKIIFKLLNVFLTNKKDLIRILKTRNFVNKRYRLFELLGAWKG